MWRMKVVALPVLVMLLCASGGAQTKVLDVGGVLLAVSDARTAQVFHVVDQVSEWDSGVHHGYVRWAGRTLKLSEEDRRLLQEHARLRRARGWGNGFEQAFYVDDAIEVAARRAVENKLLSADEAAAEQMILSHFAPLLSGLLDRSAPQIVAFRARMDAEAKRIAPVVKKLVRFSETRGAIKLPLFLVPNPEEGSGGGGANGGRIVVEIQADPDPLPILFHEALHALLWQHKEAIRLAAASVGLGWSDLNEGIAHAFVPGLTDDLRETDTLAEKLALNFQRGASERDAYAQSKKYMVALILRPLLRAALNHGETFSRFLPKAVGKLRPFRWRTPAAG